MTQPTPSPPVDKGKLTLREAIDEFSGDLQSHSEQIVPLLPPHIGWERFRSVAVTAVNLNPDLLRADRRSLFNACCKAATDGLLPDGREGALVIFNTKAKSPDGRDVWKKAVQWMPMTYGIIKKARQSGEISALRARIVYEEEVKQERFRYRISDGIDHIDHDPILFEERGKPCLAYAIAIFNDGTQEIECLTQGDIAKCRAVSRAKDREGNPTGPWRDWEDEMWKKTAIRRLAKRLPLSAELWETITRDDELSDLKALPPPATQSVTRAAALMSAEGAGRPADPTEMGDESNIIDQDGPANEPEGSEAGAVYADAEALTHRFCEGFVGGDVLTIEDLEEHRSIARDAINACEIGSDEKELLLGQLNLAYLERRKALAKLAPRKVRT